MLKDMKTTKKGDDKKAGGGDDALLDSLDSLGDVPQASNQTP